MVVPPDTFVPWPAHNWILSAAERTVFGRRPASTHDVFRLAGQLRVNPKVVARDANSISSPNSNIVGLPAVAM